MKYYSETLNTLFDTQEELQAAEAAVTEPEEVEQLDDLPEETEVAPVEDTAMTKKQLANAVETADELVKEAYANYEAAKVKAEELSRTYLAEVDAIMEPAKQAVREAEQNRYEAIKKFNEVYGAYHVTYTGTRAADEMLKAINNINRRANRILGDLFWI